MDTRVIFRMDKSTFRALLRSLHGPSQGLNCGLVTVIMSSEGDDMSVCMVVATTCKP